MAFGLPFAGTGYAHDGVGNFDDYPVDNARGAAIALGFMVGLAAIFLTILKRSGFRAMVAVGRT